MPPDIVYLCRPGASEELRFSLRSLKNLPHRDVYIFGDAPAWLSRKVRMIATPQTGGKYAITQYGLRAACNHPAIRDGFYLFNDDFYITQPIPEVPILHRGPILEVVADMRDRGIESSYVDAMENIDTLLKSLGHAAPLSYELHVPFPVIKATMLQALALKNTERFQWRSVYGNLAGIPGTQVADVKVHHRTDPLPAGPFLSTNDTSVTYFTKTLGRMFPEPCDYEDDTVEASPRFSTTS